MRLPCLNLLKQEFQEQSKWLSLCLSHQVDWLVT